MSSGDESNVHLTTATSGKPLVRMFLSFARSDAATARRLWDGLAEATAVDRTYEFELWRFDEALLIGEDWDARIQEALATADLGLLALSNAFLRSSYIKDTELPALVDVPGKRAIPLALRQFSAHADLRGLESKQIYGYRRPFGAVRGQSTQDTWINDLVDQIHRILARYTVQAGEVT